MPGTPRPCARGRAPDAPWVLPRDHPRGKGPMADLSGKKVAIIATTHVEEAELVQPRDALAQAGAEVKVYSTGTEPIQAGQGDTEPTQKIDVDGTFDDVDVDAIDALVVPGGTVNADKIRVEPQAQGLVRAVPEAGKPPAGSG